MDDEWENHQFRKPPKKKILENRWGKSVFSAS